jgi:dTDP-4-amino-4,6-dideoxygalactose transaminase
MRQAAIDALDNEFYILGESVEKFEEAFATYIGTKHAVSVSSGTNAIQMTLQGLGIGRGDEVLTSPSSFVASANAVIHAGGTPTFADVGADANLDPVEVVNAISGKTKAMLPVHLYGRPAAMDELNSIGAEHGIPVIEDACQAHGATYKGKMAGNLGHAACFSFYTTKNLYVGGDGGMVTTNDEELVETIKSLRNSGRAPGQQYEHTTIGHTSRLNTVQAAIGLAGLKELPAWLDRRRAIANTYRKRLANANVELPPVDGDVHSAYHLFAIGTLHRDALQAHLKSAGIGSGLHYPIPIHQQPAYIDIYGDRTGQFPQAEAHAETTLSLPMHPGLSDEQVGQVCDAITTFLEAKVSV